MDLEGSPLNQPLPPFRTALASGYSPCVAFEYVALATMSALGQVSAGQRTLKRAADRGCSVSSHTAQFGKFKSVQKGL
jgi:hypothetical protein